MKECVEKLGRSVDRNPLHAAPLRHAWDCSLHRTFASALNSRCSVMFSKERVYFEQENVMRKYACTHPANAWLFFLKKVQSELARIKEQYLTHHTVQMLPGVPSDGQYWVSCVSVSGTAMGGDWFAVKCSLWLQCWIPGLYSMWQTQRGLFQS